MIRCVTQPNSPPLLANAEHRYTCSLKGKRRAWGEVAVDRAACVQGCCPSKDLGNGMPLAADTAT